MYITPLQEENVSAIQKEVQNRISLQFFPESGNLIDGILTTVAFKAVNIFGEPVDISGIIKSNDSTTVLSFKSLYDGVGKFQFKPRAGEKYYAIINGLNSARVYPLPDVQLSGLNLKVEDENNGKLFLLTKSSADKFDLRQLLLVVKLNNTVVYERVVSFDHYQSMIGHLITKDLPSGIFSFTVFNDDGIPLVERLAFNNNELANNKDSLIIIKKGMGSRKKNEFEISFPDSIQRSCSVSVTDYEEDNIDRQENILTKFLLTDELKGNIHNPAYYFGNHSDTVKEALDNLMLTQGWRRYVWAKSYDKSDIRNNIKDNYLINITGVVKYEKDNRPVEAGRINVFLSTEDSSLFTYDIPVNESGRFLIDSLAIFGKTKIYYTYYDSKDRKKPVDIILDENNTGINFVKPLLQNPVLVQKVTISHLKTELLNKKHKLILAGNPEAKLLENVTVKTKIMRPADVLNEKYSSEIFRTGGKIVIDNINNKIVDRSMNGFDYVKNRITNVDTQYGTFVNPRNFSLINNKANFGGNAIGEIRKWEIGLFIDEIPADLLQLKILRADQIAMVKFFQAGFIGAGSNYPGGAIAVYLKKGNDNQSESEKTKYLNYNGYSIAKEFYTPDYSISAEKVKPDKRTTLYWNPAIYTNKSSNSVKFSFYNNDTCKKFRIIVEGFDEVGKLIHLERVITE